MKSYQSIDPRGRVVRLERGEREGGGKQSTWAKSIHLLLGGRQGTTKLPQQTNQDAAKIVYLVVNTEEVLLSLSLTILSTTHVAGPKICCFRQSMSESDGSRLCVHLYLLM